MEPNAPAAASKFKYLKDHEYRSARNKIRWAVGATYFFAVANLALGVLAFYLNTQPNAPSEFNLPVVGGGSLVAGVALAVLGFFIGRRSRVAAVLASAFAAVVLALAVYYGLAAGIWTAFTVPVAYLYFTVSAFRAIPTVLDFERGRISG